jgi:hypothetical protein
VASGYDRGGLQYLDEVIRQPDSIQYLLRESFSRTMGMGSRATHAVLLRTLGTGNQATDHRREQRVRSVRTSLIGDLVL